MIRHSAAELRTALSGAVNDCRVDGRQRLRIRPIEVTLGTSVHAAGSATASLVCAAEGTTVVAAAVSVEVAEAPCGNDAVARGRLLFHVDFSTVSQRELLRASSSEIGRYELEAIITRRLEKLYGVHPADLTTADEALRFACPVRYERPTPAVRLAAAASSSSSHRSAGELLTLLALPEGQCFDLHVDVQFMTCGAGNVLGVAAAAVRAALQATVLPSATVSLTAGSVAVHLDYMKPSTSLAAAVRRSAPFVISIAADPDSGVYVADPSPLEEAAFAVVAQVGFAPDPIADHHRLRFCEVSSRFRPSMGASTAKRDDSMELRPDGFIGVALRDLTALVAEATGALADASISFLPPQHSADVIGDS